ncbi:MAG: citrate synthase [Chloroflexi bacterium]|nr:citrate synthase [Chloroflexota bacterium]
MTSQSAAGLAGVVVTETQKSKVDGDIGKLQYHGYNILDLAEYAQFEEVVYLLWWNKLPNKAEFEAFEQKLAKLRHIEPEIVQTMKLFPKDTHPMAALRTAVSMLGMWDPNADDNSPEANYEQSCNLLAIMPTVVAAWSRIRKGKEPIAPREDLTLAANFLYMLHGTEPTEAQIDAIDAYLVLLADHGLNASTFSARVTVSTLSDIYSAVVTALGTLKGPAHGGANQKAMEQFMDIGSPDKVDAWFDDLIANKGRIMGIGHRVYKAEDPRATILRDRTRKLAEEGDSKWYDIAWQLEQKARAHEYFLERNLYANVDYYSAIVLYQLGIDVDLFTPLFAMSRVAGWCAHIAEQWEDNRLIRPRADYVGPLDLEWVDLADRD